MDKFFIVFNILVSFIIYSQERKTFDAVRFDSPPIIDGILNDNQWTKSKKLDDLQAQEKIEKKKHSEFSEKIDELNQETDILLDEIDKWQT